MIAVRLEGRLGNQLFQYAFIVSVSKKLGVDFYIDQSVESFKVQKYFSIPKDKFHFFQTFFSIKGFKNFFSFYLKRRFYKLLRFIFRLDPVIINNFADLSLTQNRKLYIGYFQSETYFNECQAVVKDMLAIKSKYVARYRLVAKTLPRNMKIAVVHIRLGDYMALKLNLPEAYYHNAIKEVNAPDVFFVIITDSPEVIDKKFTYLSNKYISNNGEIVDLQFLINADICILSNSSFSWWGAWLNKSTKKIVYAPRYWLSKDTKVAYPIGILSPDWILFE